MNEVPDFEKIPKGIRKRMKEQKQNPPKTWFRVDEEPDEAPLHMLHIPTPEALNTKAKYFGVLIEMISDYIKSKTKRNSETK